MFKRLAARRDGVVAVGLTFALVVPLTVAALRADGFDRTRVNLHDAGIWVVNQGARKVGRVNTEIETIDVSFVGPAKGNDDVLQVDASVFAFDPEDGLLARIDVANAQSGEQVEFAPGTRFHMARAHGADDPVVAAADPDGGVWVRGAAGIASLRPDDDEPTFQGGEGTVAVVDSAGVARAYDPEGAAVIDIDETGTLGTSPVSAEVAEPSITTVGTEVVLLDEADGRVVLPGSIVVDLSDHGSNFVLQHPGPVEDRVLVATDRALLAISLDDGSIEVVHEARGGPSAPARLGGCSYGAWNGGSAASLRACDGRDVEVTSSDLMRNFQSANSLVFRVNRDRILLNDLATGNNLLFTVDEPEFIHDWSQADNDDSDDDDEPEKELAEQEDCDEESRTPQISSEVLEAGARRERPTVVPVLDLVKLNADPCDVLNISVGEGFDATAATVEPVESGTALQITPLASSTRASFDVPFVLQGKTTQGAQGTVRVVVHEEGQNSPPEAVPDETQLFVGPNRAEVRHNVLLNDRDPEGDSLTLVGASPHDDSSDVMVRHQPNGLITVFAGSAASGPKLIRYQVIDDHADADAEPVEGVLRVGVQPVSPSNNNPPNARPDRVAAVVGREVTVDVLANDTDLEGDKLTLVEHEEPEELGVKRDDGSPGVLSITPTTAAGSPYFFDYSVTDGAGSEPAIGTVRVDVVEPGSNRPPVAVRDDLVARPGQPAMVDLLDNDIDLDGDVLAVTSIEAVDESTEADVELLEMRVARVTLPPGQVGPVTFRYTVTDGSDGGEAEGRLVVRPLKIDDVNLPPITVDDEVTVRAGSVSSVAVLANDVDPEGEQLVLEPEIRAEGAPGEEADVRGFVVHDQVHVVASAEASGTYRLFYKAVDPEPLTEEGAITVVVGAEDNRPPRDPKVKGRVRAGSKTVIPLPLVGLDPDGDVVAVLGLATPSRRGDATLVDGGIQYQADAMESGVDRFEVHLDDGRDGGKSIGTVEVLVVPASSGNAEPVAVLDEVKVAPGVRRVIEVLLNDTDADDDDLVLLEEGRDGPTTPRRGSIEIIDGDKIAYTADGSPDDGDLDEGIPDSFTYGVSDGRGGSDRGTVSVLIMNEVENEPPVARDDLIRPQTLGASLTLEPLENDYDPDGDRGELTIEVLDEERVRVEEETGATIRVNGNEIDVTVPEEPISVVIPYQVIDAEGDAAEALIVIPVVENLPPVAVTDDDDTVKAGESVEIDVLANDWDPEQGGELKVGLNLVDFEHESNGSVRALDDGVVEFTAHSDANGMGGFSYLIEDEEGLQAWGRAVVEITGNNFPPTLTSTEASVTAGGETVVRLDLLADDPNPSDVEGLTFSLIGGDTDAVSAEVAGSSLIIRAADAALGETAELEISVSDGDEEGRGTVSVVVTPFEGDRPGALDDIDTTHQEEEVERDVVANDEPGEAGDLRIPEGFDPVSESGLVVVASDRRTLTFRPNRGFFGTANITYTIEDGTGEIARRSTATWRVTVIGWPSAPSAPNGTAEDERVDLTWTAPSPNGADITGYLIETMPATELQRSSGTSHSFTGLTNDVAYQFRILAVNEAVDSGADQGNWSAWSARFTPDIRPETPEPPRPTFGDGQIAVEWSAPGNRGSRIDEYQVRIAGQPQAQSLRASETSHRFTGLVNGQTYRFEVRARNSARNNGGWSDWSRPSAADDINAVPAGIPRAPTNVSSEETEERLSVGGVMRVSWDWSRPSHGNGAEVESFDVTAVGDGHRVPYPNVASGFRATGLRNGVAYEFQVVATTKAGASAAGVSPRGTPTRLPNDIPSSPLSGTDGDGSSILTFADSPQFSSSEPGHGGDPDGFFYEVTTTGPVSSGQPRWVLRGGARTIDRLVNGDTYTFNLRACNRNGCTSEQRQITNVRPYGVPGQVPSLTAGRDGNTAVFSWTRPDGNGRDVSGYRTWSGSRSDISIPSSTGGALNRRIGASPGDTVVLCVAAVNPRGEGPSRCATQDIPAPPSIANLRRGTVGVDNSTRGSTCTSNDPTCYRIIVDYRNMPTGTYRVICHDIYDFGEDVTIGVPNGSYQTTCLGAAGATVSIELRRAGVPRVYREQDL